MGALVSEGDIAYLRALYPYMKVQALSSQQEMFLLHFLKGQKVAAAERAAGMHPGVGRELLSREYVDAIVSMLREKTLTDVVVTRELLTQMLFEAHDVAGDATERIKAIIELGRMHGLYADKQGTAITINNQRTNVQVNNIRQIETMDDDKLIELSGTAMRLTPPPRAERFEPVDKLEVVEAEYVEQPEAISR
jgi:hypothetical protein